MEAFESLYRALAPSLRGYLAALVRNSALADDLLQETFLQIHRALDFLADELLNFIHDEQRARKVAFLTEDLLEEV